jgi:predicted phage tail component-like protein
MSGIVKTLGGKTPQQLGMLVLRGSKRPILPNTRDRSVIVPGRNGGWDFGADLDSRSFDLECAFNAPTSSELQARAELLARLLVDANGKPRPLELVFEVHPERTYTVRYSGSLGIDRIAGLGKFTLPLVAFDPHSVGPENVYEATITASPTLITIESTGDIRTQPVIVLTNTGIGTINEITLTNEYQLE